MIFLVETLKSVFPEFHPLNMRSTRTLLKYHFRDLADLANRLQMVSMDEEMRKQGGGKGPSEILVKEVGVLKMPLYMVLQGEVSVYKPAPIIVDEKSSPENKKLTSESTKQSMNSYDLPSRNIIMSHQTLKTKTTLTKDPTVIPEDLNEDVIEKEQGLLLAQ